MNRVRPDVRLEDGPMRPVECQSCGARVEVRKSTWDQTMVQWHRDAMDSCIERRAAADLGSDPAAVFAGCTALRASVREAAVRGDLGAIDDSR